MTTSPLVRSLVRPLVTPLTGRVYATAPVNTIAPVISGTAEIAQTLTCTTGTWSGSPTSYAYQWTRDGADIGGATASTYATVVADADKDIRCEVTAINDAGPSLPALSNTLAIAALDADALAVINAVVGAGATVTAGQAKTINTFHVVGKSDGWYTNLKRLHLPIWGTASPNAIDWIARGSGTWVGGITHGAGYAQSNGTTGYFDLGVSGPSLGMTIASGYIGYLRNVSGAGSRGIYGAADVTNSNAISALDWTAQVLADWINGTTGRLGSTPSYLFNGVTSYRVFSGSRTIRGRNAAGVSSHATGALLGSGSLTTRQLYFMAFNSNGTLFNPTTSQFGAFFAGLGMSQTMDDQFTSALKTLWEGLTGLTLP
jgi:hypothetical protein